MIRRAGAGQVQEREDTMKAFTVLLAALSVLLGAGLWVGAIWVLIEHQLFLHGSVEAGAKVVKLDQSISGPGSRAPSTVFYTPVLRFTASSGRTVEFHTAWASTPPEYEVGEQVEIAARLRARRRYSIRRMRCC